MWGWVKTAPEGSISAAPEPPRCEDDGLVLKHGRNSWQRDVYCIITVHNLVVDSYRYRAAVLEWYLMIVANE